MDKLDMNCQTFKLAVCDLFYSIDVLQPGLELIYLKKKKGGGKHFGILSSRCISCPDGFYYNWNRQFSFQLNPVRDELGQFILQKISR